MVLAVAQTAAAFFLAYRVAPTILSLQTHGEQIGQHPEGQPVPLQCGGVRPEHAALLSCRPLALQVLLGLAMVAWPVWLSWAVERRLRRQHGAVCREWERRRQRVQECAHHSDTEHDSHEAKVQRWTSTRSSAQQRRTHHLPLSHLLLVHVSQRKPM